MLSFSGKKVFSFLLCIYITYIECNLKDSLKCQIDTNTGFCSELVPQARDIQERNKYKSHVVYLWIILGRY
jgi:hypothetical protein